jgi:hypothetical protein
MESDSEPNTGTEKLDYDKVIEACKILNDEEDFDSFYLLRTCLNLKNTRVSQNPFYTFEI